MSVIRFFFTKLRFSNPWKYKAPLLICFAYVMILWTRVYPAWALQNILLAYSTLFGIAGLGYFINDWADIKTDARAGKPNKVGELKLGLRLFILMLLLGFAFLPWIKLQTNNYSWILIGIEILLFLMYSLSPFRLKERGILGVITDALYAYVVPSILASLTFFLLMDGGNIHFGNYLILLSAWLILVGTRGILLHQIQDYENDIKSGIKTFITKQGKAAGEKILLVLIPLEAIMMLLFFVFIGEKFYLIIPGYLIFCLIQLYQAYLVKEPIRIREYRRFSYKLFDDFYLDVMPLIILTHLCLQSYMYLPLFVLHLVFFRNLVKNILRKFIR